jgi:uncharacterized protein YdeI (YjbR/CyaY-like superfamily)
MADAQVDPRVDAYIEKAAPFAQPILSHLRELMHKACPRANETMKWSMPFFVQQGIVLAHMAAFKKHCAFGFWGPEMKKVLAADGLKSSESMGVFGRITDVKALPDEKTLIAYMRQAGELVATGERTKSIERPAKKVKPPVKIPTELTAALKKNKRAAKHFEKMAPGKRREYADWISEAKGADTKKRRLVQSIEWIAEGKSRNWKYQNC